MFVIAVTVMADDTVVSPDGRLNVCVNNKNGMPVYSVSYDGKFVLTESRLGLVANYADFSKNLKLKDVQREDNVVKDYYMINTKQNKFHYVSNKMDLIFENKDGHCMTVAFCVANNSVAFRYELQKPNNEKGIPLSAVILKETTSFRLAEAATSFLCQQSLPMVGFARTKPSYEETYEADVPVAQRKSNSKQGFTFPCLFRIPDGDINYWALVSETGVTSNYCGSRLSDYNQETGYSLLFPQEGENNGIGSVTPAVPVPSATPWRTITVGNSLKPIVETTVQFDVLDPLYETKYDYKPGRYTWSWILWGDSSMNWDDQVKFVDLASVMGYEYILVDALWDSRIGYEGIERLAKYAKGKNVELLLWYNSNGAVNDAPQGPHGVMNNCIARKRDMKWMQKIGVKGIKVDFFGGDKQQTMQLYEEILSDANEYGFQGIFHGCTLPRGWERLYPNFVASEAALASENMNFTNRFSRSEGFDMTLHPFCRNAVASFDWGGVFMNKRFSKNNKSRHPRYTSDIFELATAITNQTNVNCVAIMPNNLEDMPQHVLDFARNIPTTWQETQFIDGYPTKYCIIARKHDGHWYIGGLNGTDHPMTLTVNLPMLAGKIVKYYVDKPRRIIKQEDKENVDSYASELTSLKIDKSGNAKVTLQPLGGIIIVE